MVAAVVAVAACQDVAVGVEGSRGSRVDLLASSLEEQLLRLLLQSKNEIFPS